MPPRNAYLLLTEVRKVIFDDMKHALKEPVRLINTFDQLCAAGGGVAISPSSSSTSRAAYTPATAWLVWRVVNKKTVVTDPKAAWYNHGMKAFNFIESKQAALAQAKAWVRDKFGEQGPWVRNRMGDVVPVRINKAFPLPKLEKEK